VETGHGSRIRRHQPSSVAPAALLPWDWELRAAADWGRERACRCCLGPGEGAQLLPGAGRGRAAAAWGWERARRRCLGLERGCRCCLGAREGAPLLPGGGERALLLLGAEERVSPLPGGWERWCCRCTWTMTAAVVVLAFSFACAVEEGSF